MWHPHATSVLLIPPTGASISELVVLSKLRMCPLERKTTTRKFQDANAHHRMSNQGSWSSPTSEAATRNRVTAEDPIKNLRIPSGRRTRALSPLAARKEKIRAGTVSRVVAGPSELERPTNFASGKTNAKNTTTIQNSDANRAPRNGPRGDTLRITTASSDGSFSKLPWVCATGICELSVGFS